MSCGKYKFYSRADAKRARRSLYSRRGRGKDGPLSIYACDICDALHLGHLPPAVRNGVWDKDDFVEEATRVRN